MERSSPSAIWITPFFPHDRFARYRKPQAAKLGKTIDGRMLLTEKEFEPEDVKVSIGNNVEWDPVSESYVSQVWGMARLKGGTITVNPIAHITEDEISVMGTIHHRDFQGKPHLSR